MNDPSRIDVERFRNAIAHRLGLRFDDTRLPFLEGVLQRRLELQGGAGAAYLERLERRHGPAAELGALADELTVNETYFFRHHEQLDAFRDLAVPARMQERGATRELCVLSAGCASGEEPYSLAILLHGLCDSGWRVVVRGIDVNPAMLQRARAGRYSAWSLRDTPVEIGQTWFTLQGRERVLARSIRDAVVFEQCNLADDCAEHWPQERYDVVFCRNVLMYMTPDCAHALVARMARALVPGGYLFLGYAETLRGLSQAFHLRHTHGAFYYQLKGTGDSLAPQRQGPVPSEPKESAPEALVADGWVAAISAASDRIRALSSAPSANAAPGTALPAWDLAPALELLRKERFGEALALVCALPAASSRDPDVLQLRALLLTQAGELAGAEQACAELLRLDELNAGAHYLLALCCEGRGELGRAREHDRIAIYLDAGFAMARLHLGLLLRRTGDRDGARRELADALLLLQREDTARLLLFGGGFTRAALVALCRAELVAVGAES